MKLLFLDIDGVLNGHDYCPVVGSSTIRRGRAALFDKILGETGAHYVVSSAWRYLVHRDEMNLDGLSWLLASHGIRRHRLMGVTRPDTVWVAPDGSPMTLPDERGIQISEYLDRLGSPRPVYCVIDDLDLGVTAAGHRLFRTDSGTGITQAIASEVVAYLNGW